MSNIIVKVGKYTNSNGEEKSFLAVDHPEHGDKITLLRKKTASGERMSVEEMIKFLEENKDWRDRLSYAEHAEFGPYFSISMVEYTALKV